MADSSPFFSIRKLTLDPANFKAVTVPANMPGGCTSVSIFNSGMVNMFVRSDPGDSTTEDTIPAGNQEVYGNPNGVFTPAFPRFPSGATICSIKPVSGTGPAILKFLG